ncbi:MAG: sodium:solute symporter family transporter [Hyphomicrobiaceae bacterium]
MAFHSRPHIVNPRLGAYFGIFAALLLGMVLLLLMFEQLGTTDQVLRRGLLFGLIGLFAVIGAAAFTMRPAEFMLAGRRVPAAFNGMAIALASLGGTGIAAGTGAMFLIGFDALVLCLGWIAGFVVMVMLFAPFFRKFGAASVPRFLGDRFESNSVRLAAAGIAAVPLLLLLVAEIKIGAFAVSWLTQGSERGAAWIVVAALILTLVPGGVRSLSWSSTAQAIAALFAILVPAAIIAVIETNLPLGQLSHGPVLRAIGRAEAAQGIGSPSAGQLLFEMPGPALQAIAGRFATPFASVGPLAFVLALLAIMAGTAASPSLLARTATAPTVYEARKSIGWTVFVAGVVIMTMSALAVFLRDKLMTDLLGQPPERVAGLLKPLIDLGLAGLDGQVRPGTIGAFLFRRDGVLLSVPMLMGFPAVLVHLIAAGIAAAALAAAGSCLTQLGVIIGEDVINAPGSDLKPPAWRLAMARGAMLLAVVLAGFMAVNVPGDPLEMLLWSLSMTASTLFPVLLLAIWWKRSNAWGVLAGLATGFLIAVAGLLAGATDTITLAPILVPTLAAPLAGLATIMASRMTPLPSRHVLEMVRDLRIPGGETVHDREVRLALQRERQQKAG